MWLLRCFVYRLFLSIEFNWIRMRFCARLGSGMFCFDGCVMFGQDMSDAMIKKYPDCISSRL